MRSTSQSDLCEPCQKAERHDTASPQPDHRELFQAAKAILDNKIKDEGEIIPTLVFAANLGEMPLFERIWEGLAKATKGSKNWSEWYHQLNRCFDGLVVPSRVVDGLPVVRLAPFGIIGPKDEGGQSKRLPSMCSSVP